MESFDRNLENAYLNPFLNPIEIFLAHNQNLQSKNSDFNKVKFKVRKPRSKSLDWNFFKFFDRNLKCSNLNNQICALKFVQLPSFFKEAPWFSLFSSSRCPVNFLVLEGQLRYPCLGTSYSNTFITYLIWAIEGCFSFR